MHSSSSTGEVHLIKNTYINDCLMPKAMKLIKRIPARIHLKVYLTSVFMFFVLFLFTLLQQVRRQLIALCSEITEFLRAEESSHAGHQGVGRGHHVHESGRQTPIVYPWRGTSSSLGSSSSLYCTILGPTVNCRYHYV